MLLDYFEEKYDKDGVSYIPGVLRTLGINTLEDVTELRNKIENRDYRSNDACEEGFEYF